MYPQCRLMASFTRAVLTGLYYSTNQALLKWMWLAWQRWLGLYSQFTLAPLHSIEDYLCFPFALKKNGAVADCNLNKWGSFHIALYLAFILKKILWVSLDSDLSYSQGWFFLVLKCIVIRQVNKDFCFAILPLSFFFSFNRESKPGSKWSKCCMTLNGHESLLCWSCKGLIHQTGAFAPTGSIFHFILWDEGNTHHTYVVGAKCLPGEQRFRPVTWLIARPANCIGLPLQTPFFLLNAMRPHNASFWISPLIVRRSNTYNHHLKLAISCQTTGVVLSISTSSSSFGFQAQV